MTPPISHRFLIGVFFGMVVHLAITGASAES